MKFSTNLLETSDLSDSQQIAIAELQKLCFTNVDEDEASDDFYHPVSV